MSETSIDKLTLTVSSDASKAASGIDKLAASLATLSGKLGGLDTSKFDKLSGLKTLGDVRVSATLGKNLESMANGVRKLSGVNMKQLDSMAGGLKAISEAGGAARAVSKSTIENIERLGLVSNGLSNLNVSGMYQIAGGLTQLGNLPKISLTGVTNALQKIPELMNALSPDAVMRFNQIAGGLATGIMQLGSLPKVNLNGVTSGLSKLPEIMNSIPPEMVTRFNQITAGLRVGMVSLSDTGKSTLGSTLTQLRKLPIVFAELKSMDMAAFTAQISSLSLALAPLADRMNIISGSFKQLPANLRKAISATDQMTRSVGIQSPKVNGLSNAWMNLDKRMSRVLTLGKIVLWARILGNGIGKAVRESNMYIENMNLFSVSMGEFAREAEKFAQSVSGKLGIDPAEWLRAQGVFMTLATGFGIAGDKASIMSKNMTQLGYDISSFYNIKVGDAMQKLESGFAGELEPLRRLGYDLSQARLQAIALSLGIDKAFSKMSQAEKSQLRYHAIMTQVTQVQGDMARTLNQPANQMRIFQAQTVQLTRALGNLFIPILMKIIPWAIAAAQVIRGLVDQIGQFFGFTLPQMEFGFTVPPVADTGLGDIDTGIADVGDSADDSNDKVKELKNTLAGFDELNIIGDLPGADSLANSKVPDIPGLDGIGGMGGDLGIDPVEYDFLAGLVEGQIDAIRKKLENMLKKIQPYFETIKDLVLAIGLGMLAWAIADKVSDLLKLFGKDPINIKQKIGFTLMVVGFTLLATGMYDMGYNGPNMQNIIQSLVGAALGIAGSLLVFGTGPLGWVVGIGLTLSIGIVSYILGHNKRKLDERKAELFGDLDLTADEIREYASRLLAEIPLVVDIKYNAQQRVNVDQLKTDLDAVITKMNRQNKMIELGLVVTEDEYKSTIDEFIENAQAYLAEDKTLTMSTISILWGDTKTGDEASGLVGRFYEAYGTEFAELGERLKELTTETYVDGEFFPDKHELAMKLQREMTELLSKVEEIKSRATSKRLLAGLDIDNLTYDSFKGVLSEVQEQSLELQDSLKQLEIEGYMAIEIAVDQAETEGQTRAQIVELRKRMEAEMQTTLLENKFTIAMVGFDFGFDTIQEKWKKEIGRAVPVMSRTAGEIIKKGLGEGVFRDVNGAMLDAFLVSDASELFERAGFRNAIDGMAYSIKTGIADAAQLTPEDKTLIAQILKDMQPSVNQLLELEQSYIGAGKKVPQSVKTGLSDYYELRALLGEADGINFLIGRSMTESKSSLDALVQAALQGEYIDAALAQGMRDNVDVVYDPVSNTMKFVTDTFTSEAFANTPEMVEAMKLLGIDTVAGFNAAAVEEAGKVDVSKEIEENLKKGQSGTVTLAGQLGAEIGRSIYNAMTGSMTGIGTAIYNTLAGTMTTWNTYMEELKKSAQTVQIKATPGAGLNLNYQPANRGRIAMAYANGGFPDQGELFIAREAGPELVGSIGGRAAVANNTQIVDAVEAGVYRAVTAANRGGGGTTVIPVYIGGNKIHEEVVQAGNRKTQRQGHTGG